MEAHKADCTDTTCGGCWSAPLDERAPDELIETVQIKQESNRHRLAAIEAKLGKPPAFTMGLIDMLADATLGENTTRRHLFTLAWEEKVAEWCAAQEAEIRKFEALQQTNGGRPKQLHVPVRLQDL